MQTNCFACVKAADVAVDFEFAWLLILIWVGSCQYCAWRSTLAFAPTPLETVVLSVKNLGAWLAGL